MGEEREYLIVLDLLYRIVEANAGSQLEDQRLLEAESLARKFFFHCASSLYLARGTVIGDLPSMKVNFVDAASVNVLARAAVESYLTFHYIFGSSISEQERDLRLYSWRLCGLKERQAFPYSIPEAQQVLAGDQK